MQWVFNIKSTFALFALHLHEMHGFKDPPPITKKFLLVQSRIKCTAFSDQNIFIKLNIFQTSSSRMKIVFYFIRCWICWDFWIRNLITLAG